MAVQILLDRAVDTNDDPVSGATFYFYEAGTTTPLTVYSDSALSTSLGTSVSGNSDGYPASGGSPVNVFFSGSTGVKVDVQDSLGASLPRYPRDNVPISSSSSSAAEDITFSPTTENPSTDAQAAIGVAATKVAVSADDTTPGTLLEKVAGGTGITLTETDAGSDETLTIAADVGTTADKIVQLDGSARLPAVDGSQLTNLGTANVTVTEVTGIDPVGGGTEHTVELATGLPSGVFRIEIEGRNVSTTNIASKPQVQIGNATDGYVGTYTSTSGSGNFTTGFLLDLPAVSNLLYFNMALMKEVGSDRWYMRYDAWASGGVHVSGAGFCGSPSAVLDRVQITTGNASHYFDDEGQTSLIALRYYTS